MTGSVVLSLCFDSGSSTQRCWLQHCVYVCVCVCLCMYLQHDVFAALGTCRASNVYGVGVINHSGFQLCAEYTVKVSFRDTTRQ